MLSGEGRCRRAGVVAGGCRGGERGDGAPAAQVLCAMQQSCAVVPADATLAEALAAMDEAGQARPEPACPLVEGRI